MPDIQLPDWLAAPLIIAGTLCVLAIFVVLFWMVRNTIPGRKSKDT